MVLEEIESFHEVEQKRDFEVLVWFWFWYSDWFSEESRAVNVKPGLCVPYDEAGSDKFRFALEGRGLHDLSRPSGRLP